MNSQDDFRNKIDDYAQTIHAIIGFMNFYRYDDANRRMKEEVLVFQGRRLEPSPEKAINANGQRIRFVTPDLGIVLTRDSGVLGEVKKSFPKEQEFWMKTFEQLMSYDGGLKGWPTENGKVDSHDIVLLLHQTRAAAVRKFYEDNRGSKISFQKPFIMIQFNRADERQPYYFFQKNIGTLTEKTVDERLSDGVSVPMEIFIKDYSTIKIYDSMPPVPYLMELIWTNVVLPAASEDQKFEKLRKNQKIEVALQVDKIIEELHQGFSFFSLCRDSSERQSKIPRREWVLDACDQFVKSNAAIWEDSDKNIIKFFFRRYDDVLSHFISLCSQIVDGEQLKFF